MKGGWFGLIIKFYLHCVSFVPTDGESELIGINKTNELPMMLDFVLKQIKCQINLSVGQIHEIDFAHALMRCL